MESLRSENMNRRSFLQSILAVGMAPAVVRAESLMKMVRRESGLIVPDAMPLYMRETAFNLIEAVEWGPDQSDPLGQFVSVRLWYRDCVPISEGLLPPPGAMTFEDSLMRVEDYVSQFGPLPTARPVGRFREFPSARSSRTAPRETS
jgi:hypothetical protein